MLLKKLEGQQNAEVLAYNENYVRNIHNSKQVTTKARSYCP